MKPVANTWQNCSASRRCLLILDGLEPLQHAGAANRGELKDRALRQMLRNLALNNQGLCVITTRIAVDELKDREPQVIQKELDNLQAADAIKLTQTPPSPKELTKNLEQQHKTTAATRSPSACSATSCIAATAATSVNAT